VRVLRTARDKSACSYVPPDAGHDALPEVKSQNRVEDGVRLDLYRRGCHGGGDG
jgi:hypothetical protein